METIREKLSSAWKTGREEAVWKVWLGLDIPDLTLEACQKVYFSHWGRLYELKGENVAVKCTKDDALQALEAIRGNQFRFFLAEGNQKICIVESF